MFVRPGASPDCSSSFLTTKRLDPIARLWHTDEFESNRTVIRGAGVGRKGKTERMKAHTETMPMDSEKYFVSRYLSTDDTR